MGGMIIKDQEDFGIQWGPCVVVEMFKELKEMVLHHPPWFIGGSNASRRAIADEMVLEVNPREYEHGWNHVP